MNIPTILRELANVGVIALTEKSVETFVETKIKPIFENWGKDESRLIELEECLSEYLLRCYKENSIMTTVVFRGLNKTLEDLYIPLTLVECGNKDKQWVIDENCYNILDNYSKILIADKAGMGKSTTVRYFACQGVNLHTCIPIVIELRRLEKKQTILEYIQKQINSYDKNIEISEIVDILRKGDFVIFFDGYDEIVNKNKSDVLNSIEDFTSKSFNTKIVITSREDDDLYSLGEYKCVNIKPLNEEEAYKLIKKYDNDGESSNKLIKRLKENSSTDVFKEFLMNPLLVSLLYKTFDYKKEIPYKKSEFYEQVYEALFNDHDKTKRGAYVHEKKVKLDKFEFERILRAFGLLSLKADKVEYSSQLIHELIKQSIERFGWLKINVDDYLYDITHAVPFIQKDGNQYKWVHKSFMEYFASCFICYENKESEEKNLHIMVNSENPKKYNNVLNFCYDIDTLSFRKYVILPYLEKYIDKYEKSFENKFFEQYDKRDIHLAKQIVSFTEIIIIRFDKTREEYNNQYNYWIVNNIGRKIIREYPSKNHTFMVAYVIKDSFVNEFISNKMPEIFEKEISKLYIQPDIQCGIEFCFNDDINNPINKDKKLFAEMIKILSNAIFANHAYKRQRYIVINFKECKRIVDEIKKEDKFLNNNNFDL